MADKNKTLTFVIIIIAVIAIAIAIYLLRPYIFQGGIGKNPLPTPTPVLPINEDVNSVVSALILQAEEEKAATTDLDADKTLLYSDNQEVSDFSQAADENEF